MLRTLRDLAQGARTQLTSELGPEFANFDLNSLNPKTAIRNALLGDDDLSSLNPAAYLQRALRGEDEPQVQTGTNGAPTYSTQLGTPAASNGHVDGSVAGHGAGEPPPFDADAT
jgi:sec-independent protein translocase protein TatB